MVYLDGGGRGEETFLLFNFSLNNLVYTFAIGVYLYKIYLCTFIFMGFYIFNKLNIKFQSDFENIEDSSRFILTINISNP